MALEEKISNFNELCGSWDYRNIDMTEPHLGYIEINGNVIKYFCEKYSIELDDYVSYNPGYIINEKLVKEIENLDFNNRESVLSIIKNIENNINFSKANLELYHLERSGLSNKVKVKSDYVK